ncbi:MAG: hypothetical protein GXP40_01345 [Chloroflexi bacterium]|nr:hypothetical protein [Chloroflexota bacterium]
MSVAPDLISGFIAFILTLLVFSYLLGDNPFFRAAIYLFVGVSAGYIAAVAWYQVLWPELISPLLFGSPGERILLTIPLVLGLLLLTKIIPPLSKIGTPAVAFLVGVGAAIAVGGAVLGTIFPQTGATINAFDLQAAAAQDVSPAEQIFGASILLVGTISTLVYFQFGARRFSGETIRRSRLVEGIALVGRIFIAITFGVLFAGVYAAALTALIERLTFLWTYLGSF